MNVGGQSYHPLRATFCRAEEAVRASLRSIALKSRPLINGEPSASPSPGARCSRRGWKNQATVLIDPITFQPNDVRCILPLEAAESSYACDHRRDRNNRVDVNGILNRLCVRMDRQLSAKFVSFVCKTL